VKRSRENCTDVFLNIIGENENMHLILKKQNEQITKHKRSQEGFSLTKTLLVVSAFFFILLNIWDSKKGKVSLRSKGCAASPSSSSAARTCLCLLLVCIY
jgi:hypothetical protein